MTGGMELINLDGKLSLRQKPCSKPYIQKKPKKTISNKIYIPTKFPLTIMKCLAFCPETMEIVHDRQIKNDQNLMQRTKIKRNKSFTDFKNYSDFSCLSTQNQTKTLIKPTFIWFISWRRNEKTRKSVKAWRRERQWKRIWLHLRRNKIEKNSNKQLRYQDRKFWNVFDKVS